MLSTLLLLQAGFVSVQERPVASTPNLLVIVVDDVGIDQVGAYGVNYPDLALQPCTPNIDALAASGVRFTNAWASAVCSPARAQILTGRRARHTGVGQVTEPDPFMSNNVGLEVTQPTIGDLLPGYASAALGKWHLSDPMMDAAGVHHPVDVGFGFYAGSLYNLETHYDDWKKTIYPSGSTLPGYNVYATTDTTNESISMIASLPEPWLVYVAYNSAHTPLHCPTEKGFPAGSGIPAGCTTSYCADCVTLVNDPLCNTFGEEACLSRAMVQAADQKIGELLAAIDDNSTAVFLMSDNGSGIRPIVPPFVKSHSKGTIYQGGINVPLIVRVPGGLRGTNHELVSLTDVFATLADLAGLPLSHDPLRDSVSMAQYVAPQYNLSNATPRSYTFSEFFAPNYTPTPRGKAPPGYQADFDLRAVRNATHKLMERRWWNSLTSECEISLEFYRINDGPGQDPAFGPDPFELDDLMQRPTTWKHADMDAFLDLNKQIAQYWPPLQVGACH